MYTALAPRRTSRSGCSRSLVRRSGQGAGQPSPEPHRAVSATATSALDARRLAARAVAIGGQQVGRAATEIAGEPGGELFGGQAGERAGGHGGQGFHRGDGRLGLGPAHGRDGELDELSVPERIRGQPLDDRCGDRAGGVIVAHGGGQPFQQGGKPLPGRQIPAGQRRVRETVDDGEQDARVALRGHPGEDGPHRGLPQAQLGQIGETIDEDRARVRRGPPVPAGECVHRGTGHAVIRSGCQVAQEGGEAFPLRHRQLSRRQVENGPRHFGIGGGLGDELPRLLVIQQPAGGEHGRPADVAVCARPIPAGPDDRHRVGGVQDGEQSHALLDRGDLRRVQQRCQGGAQAIRRNRIGAGADAAHRDPRLVVAGVGGQHRDGSLGFVAAAEGSERGLGDGEIVCPYIRAKTIEGSG